MRIGVNSGSLPKHLHELEREAPVEALVAAAIEFVELMEGLDFENFKVSIKSTNVPYTIAANRLLAEKIPYPLHLGVTEAGTKWGGSLKSAVGLGTLLADGIGDTIRISLSTFHAEEEVKVAWEILKALQLRERGPVLIACPTCGRLQFDMDSVVAEIEQRLEGYEEPVEVAVLGCAVNGIGEASHADFGIAGAKNEGLIFAGGKPLRKVPQETAGRHPLRRDRQIPRPRRRGRVRRGRVPGGGRVGRQHRARKRRRTDPREDRPDGEGSGRTGRVRQSPARRGGLADRGPPVHPRVIDAPRISARSRRDRLRFVVELVPGQAGDRVVGGCEAAIAGAVLTKCGLGPMALPAVELDYLAELRPVAVDRKRFAPTAMRSLKRGKGKW